ncbi:hypothetical protein [Vibrio scophthalmi]|uniref:Uncharacterized protein n=1 Tax=Vibrio scophthalmi TaxID=45658 RepID=A0A1E3WFH8_9VIBR|nr:hypothetical protein [Vibrio scophthalmi]ODS04554.1 hypothetical protein VSF3289_03693 [Vibrio scophthalmi]
MKISDLIKKIEEDKFDEKQLINLYNNASSKLEMDESDKELLVEAIEKILDFVFLGQLNGFLVLKNQRPVSN